MLAEIENKGFAPVFDNAKVTTGKDFAEFVDGMEVHPESNSVFSVNAASPIGIKQIYTKLSYGDKVFDEKTVELKNVTSYVATLPVVPSTPKGVVYYTVIAKDSYERTTEYNAILYSITKYHSINPESTDYDDGWKIKIVGLTVYDEINTYVEAGKNKEDKIYNIYSEQGE